MTARRPASRPGDANDSPLLQLIGVAETDAEAEDLYAEHAEYFFHKVLYTPSYYQAIPGCLDIPRWCRRSSTIRAPPSSCAQCW